MIDITLQDNLNLLKSLDSGSIDLIYSDILYGTGRDFGDYQDLKPNKKDVENHYLIRIDEMKRVLKNTGQIYLQIERVVLSSSNVSDVVADFYLGSGTTAVVCKKLNRNFIGCDISEKAVSIAKKRVDDLDCVLF